MVCSLKQMMKWVWQGFKMVLTKLLVGPILFYHSLHTSFLSVYAYVLRVCPSGYTQVWTLQGHAACCQAHIKMQPMGWFGL